MSNYLNGDKPPICLHALGQPLINALFEEGKALQRELNALKGLAVNIGVVINSELAEPFNETIPLDKFLSFEVETENQGFVLKKAGDQTTYGDLYGTTSIKLALTTTNKS
jgi:hypothetical protein